MGMYADESISKKAKDVKGLLVKAVKQAPSDGKTYYPYWI
jgi:hypothetical protein